MNFSQLPPTTQAQIRARLRGSPPRLPYPAGVSRGAPGSAGGGRRRGGRRAQRGGEDLEARIVAACGPGGAIELEPLPKSGARFTGGGQAHALPIACDFVGCVRGSGRAINFDAKRVGAAVAGLRIADPKILKPHQAKYLARMDRAGAIAGVLVECERLGDYRWLDGRHLLGECSVRWEDPRWLVLGPSSAPVSFEVLLRQKGVR